MQNQEEKKRIIKKENKIHLRRGKKNIVLNVLLE